MELLKLPFSKVLTDITSKFKKIPKKDFLNEGDFSIIDQGDNEIAGYTNNSTQINDLENPVVIFGDHTRIIKYIDFPFTIGADGVKVLSVNSDIAYPLYIYYYLKFLKIPNAGYSRHFKFLKEKDILLPKEINEQKRIAKVLSDCEALIQKRKQSIDLLDELIQATFLDIFGDPVNNEKGWDVDSFSDLGKIDRGVSKHRPRNAPELLNGNHPLIQTGDVANADTFIKEYKQTYSELGLKQSKKWPTGTLCITIAANIAKTGILTFDACFPDSIVGFEVDSNKATNLYVHYLFSFFQRILEKNAPSAAQKNINLEILRNFKVPHPPIEFQEQFDMIAIKIENSKDKFRQSLLELENLFESLSQRAFKGQLDLSKVDISAMDDEKKKPSSEVTDDTTTSEEKYVEDRDKIIEISNELQNDGSYLIPALQEYIEQSKRVLEKVNTIIKAGSEEFNSLESDLKLVNFAGSLVEEHINTLTPWQVYQHSYVERYVKHIPQELTDKYPNINLFSRREFDYSTMTLEEYLGVPDEVVAKYGSVGNDTMDMHFSFKKYFSDKSFTIDEVEELYNRIVYDDGDWFKYKPMKKFIFEAMKGDDAFITQVFEEQIDPDNKEIPKKLIKLKLIE